MPAPVYMNSINRFSGDGVTTDWNINFTGGYLRRAHVKGIVTNADGTETLRTLTISDPADFIGPNQIRVSPAAVVGEVVVLFRDTPKDLPLVDFSDGSLISEKNLDLIVQQAVFIAAEMVDKFGETDGRTTIALDTAQLAALSADIAEAQAAVSAAQAAAAAAQAAAAANSASGLEDRIAALEEAPAGGVSEEVFGALDGRVVVLEENLPLAFASINAQLLAANDQLDAIKLQTSFGTTDTIFAIGVLEPEADTFPYFLSSISAAKTPLTAFGRSLLGASNAEAARTTLEALGEGEGGGGSLVGVGAHRFWGLTHLGNSGSNVSIATVGFRTSVGGANVTSTLAYASSSFDGTTLPANAFDASDANVWAAAGADVHPYLYADFTTPRSFVEVEIVARTGGLFNQTPHMGTIVYSDDGATWYDLCEIMLPRFTSSGQRQVAALPTLVPAGSPVTITGANTYISHRAGLSWPANAPATLDISTPIGFQTVGMMHVSMGIENGGYLTFEDLSPTVAANECYARVLKIVRPCTITAARTRLSAGATGSTASYRIYTNAAGRPGVPVTDKITFATEGNNLDLVSTLPSPVVLAPGLYWVLTTNTTTINALRGTANGGAIQLTTGSRGYTGLYSGSAAARLDSTDLSASTWSIDTGATNISATRDTVWFDFTF